MTEKLIPWAEIKTGSDGRPYMLTYLLNAGEVETLQRVGLIGEVMEVVGLAEVSDGLVDALRLECETRGALQ